MSSRNTADLLIVGGGVLGCFFAYHAIAQGKKVILLERSSIPVGATVRNFGQIVPSGLDDTWQQYGRESLEIYRAIQSQCDISVRQQGSVYLASDDDEFTLINELHTINHRNDYRSEVWTAAQCRERYPQLRSEYCIGGLYFPQEISVNPRVMIHHLHDFLAASDHFASRFQSCVREICTDPQGEVKVLTNSGEEFCASKAIVCSGSEFRMLFPERFLASDLRAVKLQMLRLKPQPQSILPGNILTGLSIRRYESFEQCPSWKAVKSREPSDSFAKQWGVHILFKQEADGGIILGDSHEYASVADYDTLGFDLNADINTFMIGEAAKIMNLNSWDIETSWAGIYCQTAHPSGIFTEKIDDQIHIVTGIGGKGMTSGAGFTKHYLKEFCDD